MPRPGYYRFDCKQYEDPYTTVLSLQQEDGSPFDNTGYQGLLQIRTLDDALIATPEITFPTSTTLQVLLGQAQATAWPLPAKRYLYDLLLTNPSIAATFWLEGDWLIYKTQSRLP